MCRWSAQLWAMVLLCGAMDDGGGDSRSWCSNMSNIRSSSSMSRSSMSSSSMSSSSMSSSSMSSSMCSSSMSSSSMSSSIVSRSTAINISTSHGCGRHVSRVGSSTPTQHSQVPRSRCSNIDIKNKKSIFRVCKTVKMTKIGKMTIFWLKIFFTENRILLLRLALGMTQ